MVTVFDGLCVEGRIFLELPFIEVTEHGQALNFIPRIGRSLQPCMIAFDRVVVVLLGHVCGGGGYPGS